MMKEIFMLNGLLEMNSKTIMLFLVKIGNISNPFLLSEFEGKPSFGVEIRNILNSVGVI